MKKRIDVEHVELMARHGFTYLKKRDGHYFYGSYNKKEFAFKISQTREGYKIHPPEYVFFGLISHFTFIDEEKRQYRNKQVIFKIVNALKNSQIWDLLTNKMFFTPNSSNSHMDTGKVKSEFRDLMR